MSVSPVHRLRLVIPLLVCTFTFISAGYQAYHRVLNSRAFIIDNAQRALSYQMNLLQSSLSDSLLEGDPERARRRLSNAALDHQITALMVTDDRHKVLLANRLEWVGGPGSGVSDYDPALAAKASSSMSQVLAPHPGHLCGYYPVTLGIRQGEIRPRRIGTLFVSYDYSKALAEADSEAYLDAAKSFAMALLLSVILMAVLHLLVTKRIERLLLVMQEVAAGNLQQRSGLKGRSELAQLAHALDGMTEVLSGQHDALHRQAETLKQEVEERREIEQQLKESGLLNRQIISCAREGIVVYDCSGRFRLWNPFMEQMTGIPADDVIGKAPAELFPFLKESGVMERLEKALRGEQVPEIDVPYLVPRTGATGWAIDATAPLLGTSGEVIGAIGTVRDITRHRKTEEQLRQSQKMEAVGQLAGGIAHDFNNLLTVIAGYGEMLRMDPGLHDKQTEKVDQILVAVERASKLTRGLLAFSRKQVMNPKVCDLNDIVHNIIKLLVRVIGEDIHLETVTTAPSLMVKVDSGQIEQVLINLAANARDAMPTGGTLSIETGRHQPGSQPDRGRSYTHPHKQDVSGSYAYIAVSDTGTGMDRQTLAKIFEPFFTTKESGKGTGLGMAIVDGIVEQHGGFINVYSEPGQGTCFKIYLPLIAPSGAAGGSSEAEALPTPRGTETILVADDEAEVRNVLEMILSEYGYTVITAVDGQDAIEKFSANPTIELVILDVIMPGKNGLEAGAEMRKLRPEGVRTLYSSGYTREFIKSRGELLPTEHLIMKPVRTVELLRTVREILDRPGDCCPAEAPVRS